MVKNYYTTLVSCRIDNPTLKAIDKFLEGRDYLTRSSIINQALFRLFRNNDDGDVYNFLYGKKPLK